MWPWVPMGVGVVGAGLRVAAADGMGGVGAGLRMAAADGMTQGAGPGMGVGVGRAMAERMLTPGIGATAF